MGVILLRPERCLNCGGSMPAGGRIDRRYCKPSCRTLAYRLRIRTGAPARRRERVPKWAEGQPPVIGSALAALADLQARVVQLAHQLEQDDIAFRHPYSANLGSPEMANQREELEATLRQAQADKTTAEQRAATTEQRAQEVSRELTLARQESAEALTSTAALEKQLRQANQRQAQWASLENSLRTQLANAAKQESEQRAQAERVTLAFHQADSSSKRMSLQLMEKEKEIKALRANANRIAELEEDLWQADQRQVQDAALRTQLAESTKKVSKLEADSSEYRPLAEELRKTQKAKQALEAEVAKLRPPAAESDPLIPLMKDKVVAWHMLAQYEAKARKNGRGPLFSLHPELTSRPLPRDDQPTILAAAIQAAIETRRDYYNRSRSPYAHQPKWVRADYLLDPASEKALNEEQQREIDGLKGNVGIAKTRSGG